MVRAQGGDNARAERRREDRMERKDWELGEWSQSSHLTHTLRIKKGYFHKKGNQAI